MSTEYNKDESRDIGAAVVCLFFSRGRKRWSCDLWLQLFPKYYIVHHEGSANSPLAETLLAQ